ncbi:MAG: hypothetical protein ACWA5A_17695 [Marinibacterium sp.]
MADPSIEYLLGTEPSPSPAPGALPEIVSAATLADLFGISANRVSVLAAEGVLLKAGRGKYLLAESIRNYVDYARDNPTGRRIKDSDLAAEKVRLTRAQADRAEQLAAKTRGDLLDAQAVRSRWIEYTTSLRAALLAVPARVASQMGLDRATTATLDSEVRAALEQIAKDGGKADAA